MTMRVLGILGCLLLGRAVGFATLPSDVCPDTTTCPPPDQNRSVLVIEGGDRQAAFTTIYYLYIVNGVKYAQHKGMVPFIKLNKGWTPRVWRGSRLFGDPKQWRTHPCSSSDAASDEVAVSGGAKKKMKKQGFAEHTAAHARTSRCGVLWERFFESFCPGAEEWAQRCGNVRLEGRGRDFWFRVHMDYADWPVRAWYYGGPEKSACRGVPSKGRKRPTTEDSWCGRYNPALYDRWRRAGHEVVAAAHRLRPWVTRIVDEAWRDFITSTTTITIPSTSTSTSTRTKPLGGASALGASASTFPSRASSSFSSSPSFIDAHAEEAKATTTTTTTTTMTSRVATLAVHMRGTDKSHGRRRVDLAEFAAPVADFLAAFGDRAAVFLATDTASLAAGMVARFGSGGGSRGGVSGGSGSFGDSGGPGGPGAAAPDRRLHLRAIQTRSASDVTPNFLLHDKMQVAEDVLVDIQLMARCQYFVYAASAVAEAVMYTNPLLHNRSVNLEYKNRTERAWPWR
jgi:hypothetical protein